MENALKITRLEESEPFPNFFSLPDYAESRLAYCSNLSEMLAASNNPEDSLFDEVKNNTNKTISALRLLVGVSYDQFKNFIEKQLPINLEAQELCHYQDWPKRGSSIIKKVDSLNEAKCRGLVSFFTKGYFLPFDFTTHCNLRVLTDFNNCSECIKKRIIYDRVKGSYEATHGNYLEKFFRVLCNRFSKEYNLSLQVLSPQKSTKALPEFNKIKFDITIQDKASNVILTGEISHQSGTGSGVRRKATTINQSIGKHKHKYPDTLFVFIGGGYGWFSRRSDLSNLINYMDSVYACSFRHSGELLFDIAKKTKLSIKLEDCVNLAKDTHKDFTKFWKGYCNI